MRIDKKRCGRVSPRSVRPTLYQYSGILHLRLSSWFRINRGHLPRSVTKLYLLDRIDKKKKVFFFLFHYRADVDECARGTHSCQGICVNTVGSFECQCQEGYHLLDGDRCIDVDECLTLDPCQGICINTQGSYSCSCELGYQLGENGTCSGTSRIYL